MVLATRGERRWLRGPRRFGPTTPLFWTPIAILWESPNPKAGAWHPAQELSSCRPRILSKKRRRPRSARFESIGRPSRASSVDSVRPVNPARVSAAVRRPSRSWAPGAGAPAAGDAAEASPRTAHAQTERNSNGTATRRYRPEETVDTDMSHLSRFGGEGHPPHVNLVDSYVARFALSLVPANIRRPRGVGQCIFGPEPGAAAAFGQVGCGSAAELPNRLGERARVPIDVLGCRVRGDERHVVKGRHEDAPVQAVEVQEAVEVEIHGGLGLGAVPGRRGAELVLGAVAETDDVPRQTGGADRLLDPRDEALRQRDRPAVELRREDALQGRAHGREGERVS